MKFSQIFALSSVLSYSVLAQDLTARLGQLGLGAFAQLMRDSHPDLVAEIGTRGDVTVWAPGDSQVAAYLASIKKRTTGDKVSSQCSHNDKNKGSAGIPSFPKVKRQLAGNQPFEMDTNFLPIYTFLLNSENVNLGEGQEARYVTNFASPSDLSSQDNTATIEIATGMADKQFTLRGPFKFSNGVIYEVNDFFTLPEPFTATMEHIGTAQQFYSTVVSSGKLDLFENTPAVTIFAPIDAGKNATAPGYAADNANPEAYIITGSLYYSPMLQRDTPISTKSGGSIKVTFTDKGEKLINCRRIVKADVVTKNGLVHFIDGPLYGGCNASSPPPLTSENTASSFKPGRAAVAWIATLGAFLWV